MNRVGFFTIALVFSLSSSFAADHDPSHPRDSSHTGVIVDSVAIQDLKEAREQLEQKKRELAAREQDLNQREKVLNEEFAKLAALRDSIKSKSEEVKKEDGEKVSKLVETILTMSPKSAAKMLSAIDDQLAVSVMRQMETQRLAKIMNQLDSNRASKLSEMMTGIFGGMKGGIKDDRKQSSPDAAGQNKSSL